MYKYMLKLCVGPVVAIFVIAGVSAATTILVGPGDSIQSAIDAADDGDLVTVQSGVYRENLIVDKKLILNGENTGDGIPVIDAGGNANGIRLNAEGVTIHGFGVTNARVGIELVSNNNEIVGNEVRDSWTGIALSSSSGNLLQDNVVRDSWRGIRLTNSEDNVLYGNEVGDSKWSGIVLESSGGNLVQENIVRGNYRGIEIINSDENAFVDNELAENRYNDEPASIGSASTRSLEDIVGGQGPSSESWSERTRSGLMLSDTTGATNQEAENRSSREASEEDPGISVNERVSAEPDEPVIIRPIAIEDWSGTSLEIENSTEYADEMFPEPKAGEESDHRVTEDAVSDVPPEEGDWLVESSFKSSSGTAEEKSEHAEEPEREPESVFGGSSAQPVLESEGQTAEFVIVESGGSRKVEGIESEPVGTGEINRDEIPEVGVKKEEHPEEVEPEVAENTTIGSLVNGEDAAGATATKSSSGGWKIYELLKLIGKIRDEENDSMSVSDEMNFSEMVEIEVERLDLGTVSFYSPKDMTVGVCENVEAAIAKDVQVELVERLKGLGAPEAEVNGLNLSIKSVLEGENFRIQPIDDEVQFASNDGVCYWLWDVTPLKSGVHDLTLHVDVVVKLSNGITIQKGYPAVERRTFVDLSFGHIILYLAERVSNFASV